MLQCGALLQKETKTHIDPSGKFLHLWKGQTIETVIMKDNNQICLKTGLLQTFIYWWAQLMQYHNI